MAPSPAPARTSPAGSANRVTQRVPILVGVTGKRDLKGEDRSVRRRLGHALDTLDSELPHVPKVLLTALAVGADTLAAELVLDRPLWLVAAILPFARAIYLEDFPEVPAEASPPARLNALLDHPKTRIRTLAPLVNPATGEPASAEDLRRPDAGTNPLRDRHYEQLGLWLAETATLLLAVMPEDEPPERLGGTARVVAYRLSGQPDAAARAVIESSTELCLPEPLDAARGGPVWLIDAPAAAHDPAPAEAHLRILLPAHEPRHAAGGYRSRLERSLRLARGFDGLARRTPQGEGIIAWPAGSGDPILTLTATRGLVSRIQGHDKARIIAATYALALLFCLAVGLYDAATTVWHLTWWGFAPYLVAVFAAVAVHAILDHRRWQRFAEDYRAVNEALRVQRAWWQAGLVLPQHRADRYYLAGAQGSLLYPRQAVRGIIDWALLVALPGRPAADWSRVHGESGHSWVEEQIAYFTRRARQRRRDTALVRTASWIVFFSAQWLALWLLFYGIAERLRIGPSLPWEGAIAGALLLAVAALIGWSLRHWRPGPVVRHRLWAAAIAVPIAAGLGFGFEFAVLTRATAPSSLLPNSVGIAVAVLSALAGAMRFIADKLAWEAEAHHYEDARALFENARAALAAIDREGGPPAAALERRQAIVFALGRAALAENEAWLRAHRERPVEQALGG